MDDVSRQEQIVEDIRNFADEEIRPRAGQFDRNEELPRDVIAGMAESYYAQIAPHLFCGPVEAAANIQIDTCSPNFLIQESMETFGGFHAEILKEPIRWEDGYIIPPTAAGLGIELDEEVAAAHPLAEPSYPYP